MPYDTSLIKELREKVGSGILDCKEALEKSDGDIEKAIDFLRKKGIATASKKSSRVSLEGLVAIAESKDKFTAIEMNSETDFVAKNQKFQDAVTSIAKYSLEVSSIDELKSYKTESGDTVSDKVTELVSIVGENIQLRRFKSVSGKVLVSYVHGAVSKNLGKIGVLLSLDTDGDITKAHDFGKKIAMHIAAFAPKSLDIDSLDPKELEREKSILTEQAKASGKPDNVIEKMIQGRIKKFYAEVVLLEQDFVMDNKVTVRQALKQAESDVGGSLKILEYACLKLGEGVQ